MFGRHPRLPVDVTFGVNRNANSPNHSSYVSAWKQRLQESYTTSRQRQRKEHSNGRRLAMTLSTRNCVRAWWLCPGESPGIWRKTQAAKQVEWGNLRCWVTAYHRGTQGTANDQPATSKRKPVPRPRKRTSHTTSQGKQSSIVSNKQNLPTNSEEENEDEDVRVEVHELKTAESQESETAVTLTAQEGETAPHSPDDGPSMSTGAWDTSLGGDDHSPIEDGVARNFAAVK